MGNSKEMHPNSQLNTVRYQTLNPVHVGFCLPFSFDLIQLIYKFIKCGLHVVLMDFRCLALANYSKYNVIKGFLTLVLI